jgi:hypothetical protein
MGLCRTFARLLRSVVPVLLSAVLLIGISPEQSHAQRRLIVNGQRYAGYDADATAFFSAAGITDNTQKSAINTLVTGLKSNSLWSIAQAIYPMVGGTATTHKYNLKDPRDLDAAFRLNFVGGWTHASTGVTPNGSTGYANTFYIPNTQQAGGLISIGLYSRTNSSGTIVDMGAYNATGTKQTAIWSNFGSNFYGLPSEDGIVTAVSNTDSRGWFFASRTGASATFIQKNATQNTRTANTGNPTVNIYIGARNDDGSANFLSTREIAFVWLGGTLTTGQASTLYTLIQAYQTTLSRQL